MRTLFVFTFEIDGAVISLLARHIGEARTRLGAVMGLTRLQVESARIVIVAETEYEEEEKPATVAPILKSDIN